MAIRAHISCYFISETGNKGGTYGLYCSPSMGTIVDPDPNVAKEIPWPVGETSPRSFQSSPLSLEEGSLTLFRLRMNPFVDAPTNSGRSRGRQAPTIPMEDSTIGQYTIGVLMSAEGSERKA